MANSRGGKGMGGLKKPKKVITARQKAARKRNIAIAREMKKRMGNENPFLNKWHGSEGGYNTWLLKRKVIKYLKGKKRI